MKITIEQDGKDKVELETFNYFILTDTSVKYGGNLPDVILTEVTPINRTAFFIQYTEPPIKWFNTWRNN